MRPTIWDGSAALAFYVLFAAFPGILLLLSAASFIPYENFTSEFSNWWISYLPGSIQEPVEQVLADVSKGQKKQLLSVGVLVSLWTATSGVSAIVRQLHQVHNIKERRSWLKHKGLAFLISLALGLTFLLSFLTLILGKFLSHLVFEVVPVSQELQFLVPAIRYSLTGISLFLVFAILYYFGPDRKRKEPSLFPGCTMTTLLFLGGSYAYSFYINNFANFSLTYGSIGAVIGLLLWLYLLGLSILLGALLNHSIDQAKGKKVSDGKSSS